MKKNKTPAADHQLLKAIPKVDEFLGWINDESQAPLRLVKKAVRELLDDVRQAILGGEEQNVDALGKSSLLPRFHKRLDALMAPHFRTVINATGVVVHTNMGRSLLPDSAMASLVAAGCRYSNLEFDLATGKRGSRYSLVEDLLCELTGAEAGLVVNNNAAAVLLALDTLANGREAIVSRGQLVEIGGSFRIPDVMKKSGARLVEVGATNRTHLRDYEQAITEETALLLKVHTSNYKMIGFTSEVPLDELVALGRKEGIAVMEDLGSGSFVDLSQFGLGKEPTVQEVVKSGADVVTFSGDKLLGGPQAGLIVGRRDIIDRIKKNPLNRALRIDKFTLAALEAIFRLYFDGHSVTSTVPTLAMLSMDYTAIKKRATRLIRRLKKEGGMACEISAIDTESRVGGGALPEQGLRSRAVTLEPTSCSLNQLEVRLRAGTMPVIGRIENDRLILDMRTVADKEVVELAAALIAVFKDES